MKLLQDTWSYLYDGFKTWGSYFFKPYPHSRRTISGALLCTSICIAIIIPIELFNKISEYFENSSLATTQDQSIEITKETPQEAKKLIPIEQKNSSKETKKQQLEREKKEQEKIAQEKLRKEKILEAELELARIEQEKLEQERIKNEKIRKAELELEQVKLEKIRQAKLELERIEQEKIKQAQLELKKIEQEKIEQEKIRQEKIQAAKLELEKLKEEKLAQTENELAKIQEEKLKHESLRHEKIAEAERVLEKIKQETLKQEKIEQAKIKQAEIELEQIKQERLKQAEAEKDKIKQAELELAKIEKQKQDAEQKEEAKKQLYLGKLSASDIEKYAARLRFGMDNFARGVISNDTQPYSEDAPGIENAIKQIDYAISQAILRLDFSWDNVQLISNERIFIENESFIMQRLKIYLPIKAAEFTYYLEKILALWSENAKIEHFGSTNKFKQKINVYYGEILTHEIFLYPLNENAKKTNYAASPAPKISIIIDDIGENQTRFEKLLALNVPITFSVLPYAKNARRQAEEAWEAGQDVFLHMPSEPLNQKLKTKKMLTTNMSEKQIARLLAEMMDRVPLAVGLNNHMGSKLTKNEKALKLISEIAKNQGLYIVDSLTTKDSIFADIARTKGVTAYVRDVFLDDGDKITENSVLEQLRQAEKIAKSKGQAIVIGHPRVETIEALQTWLKTKDVEIQIVPLRVLSTS